MRRYSLDLCENMRSLGSDNKIDRIVGDTFWRNENGQDKPFQFIIYKAKVLSEITLTLQAKITFGLLKFRELLENRNKVISIHWRSLWFND